MHTLLNLWGRYVQKYTLFLCVAGFLMLVTLVFAYDSSQSFVSSEERFADISPSGLSIVPASCPSSPHSAGECSCAPGFHLGDDICVPTTCPQGYIMRNGSCSLVTTCPSGYVFQEDRCVRSGRSGGGANMCAPQYYCVESAYLWHVDTNCSRQFIKACVAGCSQGACVQPPPPEAGLRASPGIVRSGEITQIVWSATNVSACTIAGTNGDVWYGFTSGPEGKTSSPITERTTFTLRCSALEGAVPSTLTDTVTVNLLPSWREQ